MTSPALLLGLVISLLIGSIFHFIVDGGGMRLLLYLVLGVLGFGGGQWIAMAQGWRILPLGPLQMGPAVLGSVIVLLIGHWLSRVRIEPTDRADRV